MRKSLVPLFFVILSIAIFATATNLVAAQERPTVHKTTLADIGKPGSGLLPVSDLSTIDAIVDGSIVKKTSIVHRRLGVSTTDITPTSTSINGVLLKDFADKEFSYVGRILAGATAVKVVIFPSGRKHVYPALRVEYTQDWWIVLQPCEPDLFTGIEGTPQLEFRIFDPATAELTVLSSMLNFWDIPGYGIKDVYKDEDTATLVIAGEFNSNTKVWLNHFDGGVPDSILTFTWRGIEINLNNLGERLWYNHNAVTIVTESGRCDTYDYRNKPSN